MAIAGFKLKVNGGSLVDKIIDTGLVYEQLIEDLPAHDLDYATEYSIQVQSYNDGDPIDLESEWSAAELITTPEPPEFTLILDSGGNAILDSGGNAIGVFV